MTKFLTNVAWAIILLTILAGFVAIIRTGGVLLG